MLIKTASVSQFDTEEIKRGTLVWAKKDGWDEAETGFVSEATADVVTVQFPAKVSSVVNHFFIKIADAVAGKWSVRYTNDMETILSYPEAHNDTEPAGAEAAEGQ